jgi:hypothetical protein
MMKPDATENDWRLQLIDGLVEAQPVPPSSKDLFIRLSSGLFHYTTVQGLKGIIEDKCLWATAASYLNDASEIEYGCKILREVLDSWETTNGDDDSLAMTVLDCLKALFNESESNLDRAATIYVACFCTKNNLLSQWRTYGQTGGYSVGFRLFGTGFPAESAKTFGGLKPENAGYRAALMPVIYERKDQLTVLRDTLKRNLEALELPELKRVYEALDTNRRQQFMAHAVLLIEHFLVEQIVAFKDKAFEEENEWKL